ncbi:hypothetical protein POX_c03565 [Penicillium oxalicum]|uniref:Uncharacterized protein n=1 Tax=Penicillium oxalicum (strain 114-2 / CGMCC 5302) TaxID=933388 RepID=S7Z4X9_PENO1|nr:hypothetical protein POX_c03565 [Penicillium oxalicum]EPS25164.1 hypothetical protein PDE_00095 [Penicillium oxalicum 114-2]KAI2790718.1 hypothetical protein POX_c03565 [Penicillium oxalicum]
MQTDAQNQLGSLGETSCGQPIRTDALKFRHAGVPWVVSSWAVNIDPCSQARKIDQNHGECTRRDGHRILILSTLIVGDEKDATSPPMRKI